MNDFSKTSINNNNHNTSEINTSQDNTQNIDNIVNNLEATTSTVNPTINPISHTPVSDNTGVYLPASIIKQLSDFLAYHLDEQKRTRRWRLGFKYALLVFFLIGVIWPMVRSSNNTVTTESHVALIKIEGTIEYGTPVAAEPIISALNVAFEDPNSVAVVLQMNSPGGSPVQSDIIFSEINRLREKYEDKPIYAVVEEMCASGCYYIAAATDSIYANNASLVGSIGVIMDGFGAVDLMKKLGIERRMYTAGINKSFLDPFSPMTDKQHTLITNLLNDVHKQFIDAVKEGRGEALKDDGDLFSGRVYSGQQALKVGLIDEIASLNIVTHDIIGNDNLVDYSPKENLAERVAKRFGASLGDTAFKSLHAYMSSPILR